MGSNGAQVRSCSGGVLHRLVSFLHEIRIDIHLIDSLSLSTPVCTLLQTALFCPYMLSFIATFGAGLRLMLLTSARNVGQAIRDAVVTVRLIAML